MSGYSKEIKEIVDQTYHPVTSSLLDNQDDFMSSDDESYEPPTKRSRSNNTTNEEHRLLNMVGTSTNIKQDILKSNQPDLIKGKCLQMLREYEDDPENNSTSLTALQMILQLPTELKPLPISLENTFEETTAFLQKAWDHMQSQIYGQEKAKSEIIEYLVSKLLTPNPQPRILGLVGPPGVGKTSLAIHGIADVMGVPFYQISVGGLRDVTYFSGSMRCWKGAHQGKFTDILIKEKCLNPVIYIDELDKVSNDTALDIYGLLTHVTDSSTNKHIQDHYLGIDLDLSNVTFIFSYNDPNRLPSPLRDRIKEVNFEPFNGEQKVDIVRNFLLPSCLKEFGLKPTDLVFDDTVIAYANKTFLTMSQMGDISGVRYLTKCFQTLIGKIMVNVVCNRDSYNALKRNSNGVSKGRAKTARFMPYHKNIKLPYTVKISDIDYYSKN